MVRKIETWASSLKKLTDRALKIVKMGDTSHPKNSNHLPLLILPTHDSRLVLLEPGFRKYTSLKDKHITVIDAAAPNLRIYNPGSELMGGKQDYFPLGPLETTLSVGAYSGEQDFSHQSEAIYGVAENASPTVNAVGVWGSAVSLKDKARVWGGFFSSKTTSGANQDAQIVGVEVDTLNYGKPGVSPNASKDGIQIVGIGTSSVSNAIEVIGAGSGQWNNGILFASNAITPKGAYIGVAPSLPVARGIDLQNVRFTDGALLLGQESAITFANKSGEKSAILTDNSNRLLIRAGAGGLKVIDSTSRQDLLTITPDGDLVTKYGSIATISRQVLQMDSATHFPLLYRFLLSGALIVSMLINALAIVALLGGRKKDNR